MKKLFELVQQYLTWVLVAVALLLISLLVYVVARSLPPHSFTILTGREGGGYYQAALEYQKTAAEYGFDLRIQPTSGSIETLRKLENGEAGIGFVQGGIAIDADPLLLSTMAGVFYEPVWIFFNKENIGGEPLKYIYQLESLRLAIGEAGSGAEKLVRLLLDANAITDDNTTLLNMDTAEAADQLRNGQIDAAIFVVAASSEVVEALIRDPDLELMDVAQAEAYRAQFPFLTSVVLPEGAIDLRGRIPDENKHLIATVANLIVRNDFHPDLLRLMTISMVKAHEKGGLFEKRYEFPSFVYGDLPISKEEQAYLERIKNGESTLDNYLPFWAAALIDRYLLFVVPIALLLLPIFGRTPLLFTWYMRRKITRRYRVVHDTDARVSKMNLEELNYALKALDDVEEQLPEGTGVSEGHLPALYLLLAAIGDVRGRVERRKAFLMQERANNFQEAAPIEEIDG